MRFAGPPGCFRLYDTAYSCGETFWAAFLCFKTLAGETAPHSILGRNSYGPSETTHRDFPLPLESKRNPLRHL